MDSSNEWNVNCRQVEDDQSKPINKHLCSTAIYNLFGKINIALNEGIGFDFLYEMFRERTTQHESGKHKKEEEIGIGVLVGYYRNVDHLNWIVDNEVYNTRVDYQDILNKTLMKVDYILLHNNKCGCRTFHLTNALPRFVLKNELATSEKYSPSHESYLLYSLGKEIEMKRESIIREKLFSLKEPRSPFIVKLQDLW